MLSKGKKGSKVLGFSQIFILVLSTVALAFIIGQTDRVDADYTYPDGETNPQHDIGFGQQNQNPGAKTEGFDAIGVTTVAGATKTSTSPETLKGLGLAQESKNIITTYKVSDGNFVVGSTKLSGYEKIVAPDGTVSYRGIPANGGQPIPGLEEKAINDFRATGGSFVNTGQKELDLLGLKIYGGWAHLAEGLIWAGVVVGAIQLLAPLLGADSKLTNTLSIAALAGIMTYKGLASLGPTGFNFLSGSSPFISYAGAFGIAAAAITFVLLYKKEQKKVVNLQCLPWEAPLGGASCEKCNSDPLRPCSEYRCKSLGQACDLVNKGTTEERCVWVNPKDVTSPKITPWKEALTKGYDYRPDTTRPPALGSKIVTNAGGCVAPYTPLTFGIVTNEPSQCKIDYAHRNETKAFESMQFYFGETNFYSYNHTQTLRLPSIDALENASDGAPELKNGAITNLFVRCRDANGNENVDEYVFTFCTDKSPDTTPPVIESTSILSGSPVTFGSQNVSLTAFVNEPTECKWSPQDKNYQDMENTFSCATQVYQQNAQQLYPCTTTLTGVKDNADNTFFFRCKDQPFKQDKDRNVNQQSYKFMLKGSQQLNIVNAGPNGTITGSTDIIPVDLTVETDDGANDGKAICYFSSTGNEDTYVAMFETNNYRHKQTLNLGSGLYTYYFRCVDAGGNADSTNVTFNLFLDRQAPIVTRIYKEGADALKLVTNEDAECSYAMQSCNFNYADGTKMIYNSPGINTVLYAPWKDGSTYYIKCRDAYGNLPSPNACSIVASATNVK